MDACVPFSSGGSTSQLISYLLFALTVIILARIHKLFHTVERSSPFATVSKIGHFSFTSLHWRPCSLSCINEYLAIDSGGNVSDLVLAHNCCLARMIPGEAENGVVLSEWTGLSGKAKSVKRFERSNGLDTALYKNYLFLHRTATWKRVHV